MFRLLVLMLPMLVVHHLRGINKVVQVWVVFQVLVRGHLFLLWGTLVFRLWLRKEFRFKKDQVLLLLEQRSVRRTSSLRVRSGCQRCHYLIFRSGRSLVRKRFCVSQSIWVSFEVGLRWHPMFLPSRLRVRFGILMNFTWVVWSQPNSWGQVVCWRCCSRFSHLIPELTCLSRLMLKGLVWMAFLLHIEVQVDLKLWDCLGRSSHSGQELKHLSSGPKLWSGLIRLRFHLLKSPM